LTYDGLDRLVAVTEAYDTTTYAYDALDDLITVSQTDTISSPTHTQGRSFTYDSLKRLKTAYNPENQDPASSDSQYGKTTYNYDAAGNLVSKVSPKTDGTHMTCYGTLTGSSCDNSGYDSLNRVTKITYSDSGTPSVAFCYDGRAYSAGACSANPVDGQWMRRTAAANWTASTASPPVVTDVSATSYTYDVAGRLTSSTQTTGGAPYSFAYTYYNDDSLASITYPSNRTVTTCYDSNGRIRWVDGTAGSVAAPSCPGAGGGSGVRAYATASAYWPQGAVETLALGNGVTESSAYNIRLQMTGMTALLGSTTRLGLALSYTPQTGCGAGNNGNVGSQAISYSASGTEAAFNATQTYCYDGVNRLTTFAESSQGQTNAYDGFGNRWVSGSTLDESALTPTAQNWYDPANNRLVGTTPAITYDDSGNQTLVNPFHLTYDGENRLIQAVWGAPGNVTVNYAYDADGRRVQKQNVGTAPVTYVYDGFGNLAAEYGSSSAVSGTQYLTADHLGSTRLVTDALGGVVGRHDYAPFGEELPAGLNGRSSLYSSGAGDGVTLKFTGKERDAETGLDYFGARYFSGAQGRFTTPDWSAAPEPAPYAKLTDPQTLNLYAYVRNNPLALVDMDGHTSCEEAPQLCATVRDAIASGQSIQQGWANYNQAQLTNAFAAIQDAASAPDAAGEKESVASSPFSLYLGGTLVKGTFEAAQDAKR
jgi:RHS repeat-associated protein